MHVYKECNRMSYPVDAKKLKVVSADEPKTLKQLLTPNKEWREIDKSWASSPQEMLEDYIYSLVLKTGANAKLIANRFGYNVKDVQEKFGHVIMKAQAELSMMIFADQINEALTTSVSAQLKMYVGKHFAGQLDQPSITTQDSEGNDIEFAVKLVQVEDKKV